MTISQYRDDAASSLSSISNHVKSIRKHNRTKRDRKEFLKAFEKDFLDNLHTVVAARNVNEKEKKALNKIKIVHYNSARLCLEDIVKRKTFSWRRFKCNQDIFRDVDISKEKFELYLRQWNGANDVLVKTKPYVDDDKIKNANCFDCSVKELTALFEHVDELLTASRPKRWFRVCFAYTTALLRILVLPTAVLVLGFLINKHIQEKGSGSKEENIISSNMVVETGLNVYVDCLQHDATNVDSRVSE